jgi:LuxR family maltose regulon positive regulatory protein
LQEAHAELAGERLPRALAAWAALLEDRAALLLNLPTAAASAVSRLSGRGDATAELLLMRSWSEADSSAFAFRCLASERRPREPLPTPLSTRERDVLAQLVSLSSLGEIAEDLDVSVNTVKSHVRAIYGKLGVSTRRAAVLTALEHAVLT